MLHTLSELALYRLQFALDHPVLAVIGLLAVIAVYSATSVASR